MNSDNFIQLDIIIYELICAVKKNDKDILFIFTVEVSFNADEATFNNDEDMQMKKSTKNDDIVKSMKNDNIILLTKTDDIVKSINYDDFMSI